MENPPHHFTAEDLIEAIVKQHERTCTECAQTFQAYRPAYKKRGTDNLLCTHCAYKSGYMTPEEYRSFNPIGKHP